MTSAPRPTATLTAALLAGILTAAGAAPAAHAGGSSPIVGPAPGGAIATPDGGQRFHVGELRRGTLIRASGRTRGRLRLAQPYMLSAVAYDGTPGGLSADGRTLVLARPETRGMRPLRGRTRFAVIDAANLRLRRTLTLRGRFGYDALSPDGRWLYLIESTAATPGAYSVRAYDLRRWRMRPGVIIDPSEKPAEMWGFPMARATSPDGRFEYTLYDGADHDFIHVLDTVGRKAKCIDLPHLHADANALGMAIAPDGQTLSLASDGEIAARVDLKSRTVSLPAPKPPAPREAARREAGIENGDGGFPWILAAAAGLVLAGGIVPLRRRRAAGPSAAGAP